MKLEKILALIMVLSLILGLSACGGKTEKEGSSLDGVEVASPLEDVEQPDTEQAEDEDSAVYPIEEEAEDPNGPKDSLEAAELDVDFVSAVPVGQEDESGNRLQPAIDWSLRDQNGVRHSLKEYAGKIVILNFWQTWCPPCLAEMPDFQKVYEDYGKNENDVIILGVSSPKNPENQFYTQESRDDQGIKEFMDEKGITYPTLMDYSAKLYSKSKIMAFPTTFFIDPQGNIFGFYPGGLSEANLVKFIEDIKAASAE